MTDAPLTDQLAAAAAEYDLDPTALAAQVAAHIDAAADQLVHARAHRPALARIAAATTARAAADAEWRDAIAGAAEAGAARTRIAREAGVTRQWVSAIVRDRVDAESAAA